MSEEEQNRLIRLQEQILEESRAARHQAIEAERKADEALKAVHGSKYDREGGLVNKVRQHEERISNLKESRAEADAVRKYGRWMVGTMLVALGTLIAVTTLMARVMGAI